MTGRPDQQAPGDEFRTPDWPICDETIREAFASLLQDGSWGRYHGPHCDALREALAEVHNVEHVILCSSGTAAVELALRAVKVAPGDEVVMSAYDYKANFANVVGLEATPVLVDTLPHLPVPDPALFKPAATNRTRAIICSHLHGCLAPVTEIRAVAAELGVPVIEDACQATGARILGHATGSLGNIGVLSFGGSKLLTAGRGGAILTNDGMLAQRIRLYTQRGNDAYPLSEMQAAVLLPQLHQLAERNEVRRHNVCRILDRLSAQAKLYPALDPDPRDNSDNQPAFYKVAFRYVPENADLSRDELTQKLRQRGIAMDPAFAALHRIHGRSRFRTVGDLPNASALHTQLMTLHHPVLLQSPDRIQSLIAELTAVLEGD